MPIVTNIVTPPRPRIPVAGRMSAPAGTPVGGPSQNGTLHSGHTRVFADVAPEDDAKVTITFTITVNAVLAEDFNSWRGDVDGIVGAEVGAEIGTFAGIGEGPADPEAHAARFSLATYSFAASGDWTTYDGQDAVTFCARAGDPLYHRVMNSVYHLRSDEVKLGGTLIATDIDPHVSAFVSVTYFEFDDGSTTSFVGYRGPIVLVEGDEEKATPPGILAPQ